MTNDTASTTKTLAEHDLGGGVFLFPGGWEGKLRGMTVRDENIVLDRDLRRKGAMIDELLKAVVEEAPNPAEWLVGDRVFAVLALRRLTHGDLFEFETICAECQRKFAWEADLSTLEVKSLSDPANFEPGRTFSTLLPDCGRTVEWKLLRGKDEKRLQEIRKETESLSTVQMLARAVKVEGEDRIARAFFENLTGRDAATLREAFDDADCGVETAIVVECPHCRSAYELELPVGADFFVPSRTGARKKRQR